jgi:predicted nucleotidyltransferase
MTILAKVPTFDEVCGRTGLDPGAVRAEVLSHFRVETAFATGSFVEGRQGPTSDLDVRAVCCPSSEHPEVDRNFSRRDLYWCGTTRMNWVSEVPVHIVYWPSDVVEALRRKVADAAFDGETAMPVFTPEQVELFEEARIHTPVVDPAGCDRLVRGLDLPKFGELVHRSLKMRYDQACGETHGPLAKGDVLMAAVRSRAAVEAAVDCWIDFHGGKTAKGKWRLRELTTLAGEDAPLVRDFLGFVLDGIPARDEAALRAQVERRLFWCNTLLLGLEDE